MKVELELNRLTLLEMLENGIKGLLLNNNNTVQLGYLDDMRKYAIQLANYNKRINNG
jgi:hypothetical protein